MAEKKSRLAQIYKREKEKGGGILSTLGKRALEKVDPRQVFNQEGLLAEMMPILFKAYRATPDREKRVGSITNITNNYFTQKPTQVSEKLDSLILVDSKITAKNTMVLPAMSRDMNLMRQNIAKLVKISGGKPTYKTDLFFKGAKERESAYENLFKRESKKATPISPTPEKSKEDITSLGFLGMIVKFLKDMKDGVINSFKNIGTTILNGILTAFNVGNILKAFGLDSKIMMSIVGFVAKIVTNPFFLGLAAITSVTALLDYLRGKEDEKQKRFLELSKRKAEGELLTEVEEQELKDLGSLKNIQEAVSQYGYNPITGEKSETIRTEGIRRQILVNEGSLKDRATKELMNEGNTNPLNYQIAARAEEIRQRESPTFDESYDILESKRFRRMAPEIQKLPTSEAGAGRGVIQPPIKIPTQPTIPQSTAPTQVPKNPLLELIARGEAIKDKETKEYSYDSMNQGTVGGRIVGSGISTNVIGQKLTDMTVGDIMNRAPDKNMSAEERKNKKLVFAAGRYQITPSTLDLLVKNGKATKDQKFTPELQDKLALDLIEMKSINKLIKQNKLEEAQFRLAQEWASMPVPSGRKLKSGVVSTGVESFYGGANKAHITSPQVVAALQGNDSTLGVQLATRSAENARTSTMNQPPIVVNAPTTNNVQSPSTSASPVTVPASVVDDSMAKLLSRTL